MAGFGLKGIRRSWGPDVVVVEGNFIISAGAIASIRPHNISGFTLTRAAAGVYQVLLDQAFASVIQADCNVGPASTSTGALPTALVAYTEISEDFITTNSTGTTWAADTSSGGGPGKNIVVLVINTAQNALTDVPANYRETFQLVLAESQLNK